MTVTTYRDNKEVKTEHIDWPDRDVTWAEALVMLGFVDSKAKAKRLIKQGGVRFFPTK